MTPRWSSHEIIMMIHDNEYGNNHAMILLLIMTIIIMTIITMIMIMSVANAKCRWISSATMRESTAMWPAGEGENAHDDNDDDCNDMMMTMVEKVTMVMIAGP